MIHGSFCLAGNLNGGLGKILDGISFTVPAGKSVAIVGTSGSGKASVGANSYFAFAFDLEQLLTSYF